MHALVNLTIIQLNNLAFDILDTNLDHSVSEIDLFVALTLQSSVRIKISYYFRKTVKII